MLESGVCPVDCQKGWTAHLPVALRFLTVSVKNVRAPNKSFPLKISVSLRGIIRKIWFLCPAAKRVPGVSSITKRGALGCLGAAAAVHAPWQGRCPP